MKSPTKSHMMAHPAPPARAPEVLPPSLPQQAAPNSPTKKTTTVEQSEVEKTEAGKASVEKKLVGLHYNGEGAPTLSAKAYGALADEIQALAEAEGIYIHQDEALVNFLSSIELNEAIPENLYVLIAELLSFAYILRDETPEGWTNPYDTIDTQA